jgi:hypothetical protein
MSTYEGKTVLVVGAGASAEYRLPTGDALRKTLQDSLDIRFCRSGVSQISGDRSTMEAIRKHGQEHSILDINEYLDACWLIRDGLPLAISIDNLMNNHRDNSLVEICGKLGIVAAIIKAERDSSLYVDLGNRKNTIDFSAVNGSWLVHFWRLLTADCRLVDLENRLRSLVFVIFNYDRAVEHFFFHAIKHYFKASDDEASRIASAIEIYHPYGRVGALPWKGVHVPTAFGTDIYPAKQLELTQQIRTFMEGIDPAEGPIQRIRTAISQCRRIVFLGFAFHELNMKLLESDFDSAQDKECFATAFKISAHDCGVIRDRVSKFGGIVPDRVTLRNDLKCAQLFEEYRLSLVF